MAENLLCRELEAVNSHHEVHRSDCARTVITCGGVGSDAGCRRNHRLLGFLRLTLRCLLKILLQPGFRVGGWRWVVTIVITIVSYLHLMFCQSHISTWWGWAVFFGSNFLTLLYLGYHRFLNRGELELVRSLDKWSEAKNNCISSFREVDIHGIDSFTGNSERLSRGLGMHHSILSLFLAWMIFLCALYSTAYYSTSGIGAWEEREFPTTCS